MHPLWMAVSLLLATVTLRAGLRLRRARQRGVRRRGEELARHLRLAKPTLVLLLVGFGGGPLSMFLLRGRDPFGTAHAWTALCALALFVATGVLGRRLERGRSRAVDAHALLGVLSVLAGAAAFGTGFVLLP